MSTTPVLYRVDEAKGGEIYTNVGGTALANGNVTQWVDIAHCRPEIAWQVTGTFGAGGSVQLEFSNDGTNAAIQGSALIAAGFVCVTGMRRYFRFNCTAGDGTTALVLTMVALPQRGS